MGRYNSNTLWRIYQIGGADLALRYAELSSSRPEPADRNEYAKGSDLEIIDLRFFAGGTHKPEPSAREFGSRFPSTTTQYVYYQLDFRSPWRYSSMRYTVRARYYNSANVVLCELKDDFETRPDQPRFSRATGCGKAEPGNWTPGTYRVEVEINYRNLRTAEFTIFNDASDPLADFRRSLFSNLATKTYWELPTPPIDLLGIARNGGRRKKQ